MRIFIYLRYGGFTPGHVYVLNGDFGRLHASPSLRTSPCTRETSRFPAISAISHALAAFSAPKAANRTSFECTISKGKRNDRPLSTKAIFCRPLVDIAMLGHRLTADHADMPARGRSPPPSISRPRPDSDRTYALGDGDVPWPAELRRLLGGIEQSAVATSRRTAAGHPRRHGAFAFRVAPQRAESAWRSVAADYAHPTRS